MGAAGEVHTHTLRRTRTHKLTDTTAHPPYAHIHVLVDTTPPHPTPPDQPT